MLDRDDLTPEEEKFLDGLRAKGHAVVVVTRYDLEGANRDQVEAALLQAVEDEIRYCQDMENAE